MAQKTDAELLTQKQIIEGETTAGANTAARIGQMNEDIIDSKINNDKIETDAGLATALKTVAGRDAVKSYIDTAISTEVTDRNSAITTAVNGIDLSGKANIASPTFTGVPAAPTAPTDTDTTQIATTAFVHNVVEAAGLLEQESITGAASLTSDAIGKIHILTGTSADYTIDLPTAVGNEGGIIFKGSPSLTKIVTIQGTGGQTIDGETERKIGTNGMISLISDGANWVIVNEVGSWIPYTPVITGFLVDPVVTRCEYFRQGKICHVHFTSSSNGTSNATTKTITLPFNSAAPATVVGLTLSNTNNGTNATTPGLVVTRANSNTADVYRDLAVAAWTASGNAKFSFNINYKKA